MNDRKNSDLHMHSNASDGGYSPTELMHKCKNVQLEIVSLTDHDTVSGIEEAMTVGEKLGIKVIPGIELSTIHQGKSVHILGYGIDWKNPQLNQVLSTQQELRKKRLLKMVQKLQQIGIYISADRILKHVDGGSPGRPHVAKALVEAGHVQSVAEAFDRYLSEGKPIYTKKSQEMTVKEAIDLIHLSGGLAIVAHPVYYNMDHEMIHWIKHWNLDGIEVYHRDHNDEITQHYENLCQEVESELNISLFRSGGSDFHHENYGRVIEPLGVTRIHNEIAERIIQYVCST